METTTMTRATQISGVGHLCPQARTRPAATRAWFRGTTVPARVPAFAPTFRDRFVPALGDGYGATVADNAPTALSSMDVVHLRTGRPPV
jgi:hypothetical protein